MNHSDDTTVIIFHACGLASMVLFATEHWITGTLVGAYAIWAGYGYCKS